MNVVIMWLFQHTCHKYRHQIMYSLTVNSTVTLTISACMTVLPASKTGMDIHYGVDIQYPLNLFLFFFIFLFEVEDLEICRVLNMKKASNELVRSSTAVRLIICTSRLLQIKTNLPPPICPEEKTKQSPKLHSFGELSD